LRPCAGITPSVGKNDGVMRRPFNCCGSPLPVSVKLSNALSPTDRKRRSLIANLFVPRPRNRRHAHARKLRIRREQRHQRRRVFDRDWIEHQAVVNREKRRIRGNPERDRQYARSLKIPDSLSANGLQLSGRP
jgi:hypothetical protein